MSIELIYGGEETLIKLLNDENGTTYTVNDVIIGAPTSSADTDYNTDIDITIKKEALPEGVVPEGEIGVLIPIHYNRLDMGRLFATKHLTLRFAESETIDSHALAAAIQKEVKVILETEGDGADFVVDPIDSSKLPTSVLLRATETSLRFTGQFAVDVAKAIVQDTTIITPVEEVANAPITAPAAIKADGTLQVGNGNPNGKLIVADNGELQIAVGARRFKNTLLVAPVDNEYTIVVGETSDWNFPYSFALLDKKNGSTITDLYDITLKATATTGGGVLNFALKREFGKLVFVDTANNLRIINGFVSGDQSVYQDIQRVSLYKAAFGSIETNDAGALLGEFTFEVKAVRKQATGIDPVVVNFTVQVEKEAAGASPQVFAFSAPSDEPVADEDGLEAESVNDGDIEGTDTPAAETPVDEPSGLSNVEIVDEPAAPEAPAQDEEASDFDIVASHGEGETSNFTSGADQPVWIKVDGEFIEAKVEDLEVGNVFLASENGPVEYTVVSINDNRPAV